MSDNGCGEFMRRARPTLGNAKQLGHRGLLARELCQMIQRAWAQRCRHTHHKQD